MYSRLVVVVSLAFSILAGCSMPRNGLGPGNLNAATNDSGQDPQGTGDIDGAAMNDGAPPDGDTHSDAPLCDRSNTNLVLCLDFESGPNPLIDGSSYGNNAATQNVTLVAGKAGQGGRTVATSQIDAGNAQSLDVTELTIETWLNPASLPNFGRVGIVDKDGSFGLFIQASATNNRGSIRCLAGAYTLTSDAVISPDQWSHVACVVDKQANSMSVYWNGQLQRSLQASVSITKKDTHVLIGENGPFGNDQFLGTLDSFRIWNVARTAAQIAQAATN